MTAGSLWVRAPFALALIYSVDAFGQNPNPAAPAAGCAVCSGCGGLFIVFWLAIIALQISLLVWVARDAKARGMDSAILWMLFVLFVPLIGILIYLFARPQGNMIQCQNCHNKRLEASVRCPHCGIGS